MNTRHLNSEDEQALISSQNIVKLIYQNSPMMMGVIELDGNTIVALSFNAAVAKLFGLSSEDIHDQTSREISSSPEEKNLWLEHYRLSQQTGQPVRYEYERPGQEPRQWISATVNYLGPGNQNHPRFSFIAEDITERKHIEESLRNTQEAFRQSEARFRALIESYAQTVWETDAAGMVVSDLPSWRVYTGQRLEESLEEGWVNAVHPDDREYVLNHWREGIRNGVMFNSEYRIKSPDGSWRWTNERAVPIRDDQGQVRKWVGMNIDITARKQAEIELRASESRQTFLLNLSDRLRSLPTSSAVEAEACRVLGEFLHVDRVHYAEVEGDEIVIRHEYTSGVPFPRQRYRLSEFNPIIMEKIRKEGAVVVHTIEASPPVMPAKRNFNAETGIRAYIGTFLIRNDQWTAGMAVHSQQPRNWSPEEVALVKAVAERTWEANERVRASEALQRRNDILAGINRIFDQVFQAENEESVGQVCLHVAKEITGSQIGFIGEFDPHSEQINAIAINMFGWPAEQGLENRPDPETTSTADHDCVIPSGFAKHGLFGRVLQHKKSFYTNDPQSDPDWVALPLGHRPLSSFLGSPLYYHGQIFGMIGLGNRPGGYNLETQQMLEAITPAIVQAIQSKRAEIALRLSEERFRTSIDAIDEGFAIFSAVRENPGEAGSAPDAKGKVIDFRYDFVNQWVCNRYNLKPTDIIGRVTKEMAQGNRARQMYQLYLKVLETGQPQNIKLPFTNNEIVGNSQVSGVFNVHVAKFGDGVIVVANDVTEQVRLENEHQEAKIQMEIHHRLSEQREKERQSFARDIHDGPIQTLSSLSFQMQYLKDTHTDPELQAGLSDAILNVRCAIQELRQVMNELRTPQVIRFGLAKAIRLHVDDLAERYPQITWNLSLDQDDPHPLPEATALALYRIYQEAVNNAIRHSGGTEIQVEYRIQENQVTLSVHDNGKGFSEKPDIIALTKAKHFGLAGISERVEALHGELEIQSEPGKGATIKVTAPNLRTDQDAFAI